MNYLTSLRGIAAFLVVLYHLKDSVSHYVFMEPLNNVFKHGYLAVDFFFLLSGFIISYSYYGSFNANVNRKELVSFITKRFARIAPLHIFVLLMFTIFPLAHFFTGRQINPEIYAIDSFLAKLFLVDMWFINSTYWDTWNFPSWTISGEWLAYLLFPFVTFVFPKNKITVPLLLVLLITSIAYLYSYFGYSTIGQGIGTLGIIRCVFMFYVGFCIFHIYDYLKSRLTPSIVNINLFLSFTVTLVLGFTVSENHFFIPACFAWILLSLLLSNTFIHRALNHKWLVYLGDISYSLYLTHIFVRTLYSTIFMDDLFRASLFDYIAMIVLCFILSHFTYQCIEKPARKFIVRKYVT